MQKKLKNSDKLNVKTKQKYVNSSEDESYVLKTAPKKPQKKAINAKVTKPISKTTDKEISQVIDNSLNKQLKMGMGIEFTKEMWKNLLEGRELSSDDSPESEKRQLKNLQKPVPKKTQKKTRAQKSDSVDEKNILDLDDCDQELLKKMVCWQNV